MVCPRAATIRSSRASIHRRRSSRTSAGRIARVTALVRSWTRSRSTPYEDNSSIPPSFTHPHTTTISLADYPKLVRLLAKAFGGTAQAGAGLPIVYDEFGVQSRIPARKRSEYDGRAPRTDRPVTEATQSVYYLEALALAACQPTVQSLLFFHVSDEPDLDRWQSGLYYTDDTPKTSLSAVQRGIDLLREAGVRACSAAAVQAFTKRAIGG